jgi:Ca2+/Na+ antiporter
MKPHSIGRALGIGMRVAGRIAGQRLVAGAAASPTGSTAAQNRAAGQAAGRATGSIARGIGGFLRPFRRLGGMLWLEVMGAVFFLPVVVFSSTLWRTRASYAHGPDHRTFLVTAGIVLVFLYLSASSFWRARRR